MDAQQSRIAQNAFYLRNIAHQLSTLGIPYSQEKDTLRVELAFGDTARSVVYLVGAQYLFSLDEVSEDGDEAPTSALSAAQKRELFDENFYEFQSKLFEPEHASHPRKDLYLVAVGTGDFLRSVEIGRLTALEFSTSTARKYVVTLERLQSLLASFVRSEDAPCTTLARVEVFAEIRDLPQSAKAPTAVLMHDGVYDVPEAELLVPTESAELRRRMEAILLKVMGGLYRVLWHQDSVNLAKGNDVKGCPAVFASTGEQRAFAFAHFIAKASLTATPATTIALHCALNNLSTLWFLGAMDVLRELVLATGASVQLQLPQAQLRDIAAMKLKPVAAFTAYERSFA